MDLPTAVQMCLSTQLKVKFVKENMWIDNYNYNSVLCFNIWSNMWNVCLNVQVGIFVRLQLMSRRGHYH